MMRMLSVVACLAVFLVTDVRAEEAAPTVAAGVPSVDDLLKRVSKTMADARDYTGVFVREERMDGKLGKQTNRFKFAKPFKVYLAFIAPHKGREVLFVRGWNDNEIRVHKGSFPDLTVNLDPHGSMAMNENHHSVLDFGLAYTAQICKRNLDQLRKRNEGEIRVEDGGTLFGQAIWKVTSVFPKGGYHTLVREDETLWDVARRTGQDMYWILYSNRKQGWDEADDPDEGDKVFVPRYYGARAELMLDKQTGLPVQMIVWDHSGNVYERYTYRELKINTGLTSRDFDPDNPKYNF